MTNLQDVNLNRLTVFVAVVEAGSITAAADRLRVAKTVVSSHLQRLETEIGAGLLVRTTRRMSLTDAGQRFYKSAREILQLTELAIIDAAGDNAALKGALRISAPIDYGALVVVPALVRLREMHPQLDIELSSNDSYVDLIADRIDIAVRLGRSTDSTYRSAKIGSFVKWVVASPAFIQKNGMPRTPAELAAQPFIALSTLPRPTTIDLQNAEGVKNSLKCHKPLLANTAYACRAATLAGGGLALLTDFSTTDDIQAGTLVRLLPEWSSPKADIRAVFPPASRLPPKSLAVLDLLRALS